MLQDCLGSPSLIAMLRVRDQICIYFSFAYFLHILIANVFSTHFLITNLMLYNTFLFIECVWCHGIVCTQVIKSSVQEYDVLHCRHNECTLYQVLRKKPFKFSYLTPHIFSLERLTVILFGACLLDPKLWFFHRYYVPLMFFSDSIKYYVYVCLRIHNSFTTL